MEIKHGKKTMEKTWKNMEKQWKKTWGKTWEKNIYFMRLFGFLLMLFRG